MNYIDIINRLIPALADASALVLVTLAIVLIFRTSYTTNFAQGMIATSGAYITIYIYSSFLIIKFPNTNPFLLTIIAFISGIIVGFLLGVFIDKILVRKAKYSNVLTKQMITMGVVLFLLGLLPTLFYKLDINMPAIPRFFRSSSRIDIGQKLLIVQHNHIYSILLTVLVVSGVFAALKFTKWGLGVRATAANENVAGMMGVNTRFITAMSWGIAGALGTLGALMYATTQTVTSALMTEMQINGFLAAILGGFSSFIGPVVGAIIIPILGTFINYGTQEIIVGGASLSIYYKVFVYIIILIIILIKPIGLFGKKIAKKV